MRLSRAASLPILALLSATGVLADVEGVRNPPTFTSEETQLIAKDARLTAAAQHCSWALRQALDLLDDLRHGASSRLAISPEPCRLPRGTNEQGRASTDEGALDILKILKEAAGQGTARLRQGTAR
ncbi:MAG TPA: hypothetical protein VFZ16_15995 [Hyphomicrobiaceae bacterium]|nr:hypothetical protein [Hyphomicrobiaceae bacterium]